MAAPQRIAVTGSTGLIGSALVELLRERGDRVHRVVRQRDQAAGDAIYWSVRDARIDPDDFRGIDAVVHLAGHPIGERWRPRVKAAIRDSRVEGTALMAQALASLDDGPRTMVSGSAVGYYGSRGDEVLSEEAEPGDDFIAGVVVGWEQAAEPARAAGLRVVHPRTGVVIARHGPLIEKVELPFRLGVGGRIGSGTQYVPWISLEDQVRALAFCIDSDLAGPVNCSAPTPVTNAELTDAIGDVMHRPTVLPVPVLAIRALYGEMGVSLATVSQRVLPVRLLEAGFEFRHVDLRDALRMALT